MPHPLESAKASVDVLQSMVLANYEMIRSLHGQVSILIKQRDDLQAKLDEIEKKREEDRLEYLAGCP